MDENPTTETRAAAGKAMPETVKEPGLPKNVSQLRQKLGQKAKQEPKFRFYVLYGRIYRMDLQAGYQVVYDADLKGYFDSIPHSQLLACLRMRVVDRSVLTLIRMWLEAPVVERSEGRGGSSKWSRPKKGTPQGGVASPLLANLYLHWFDALFHGPQGPARRADVKLVRYADDFVALAKQMGPETIEFIESRLEGRFQL